jgi:hypothetical protein
MGERALRIWRVEFQDLYERHLCRHSQFGNNVVHLACLIGMYFGLYGIVCAFVPSTWGMGIVLGIAIAYLILLATNVPLGVLTVTTAFLACFFAGFFALPKLDWWWYVIAVVVCYKLQSWSHKVFTKETDMTEFEQRYKKGPALFVVLSVYELPILLNYLFFRRRDWCS